MKTNEKPPEKLPDSSELKKIRATVRKSKRVVLGKLKKQYGLSITRETALPAMQRLTDLVSAGPVDPGGRLSKLLAKRNRKINARYHTLRSYAGKQGGGGNCDMLMFGPFRMKFNGCEVMAVYNLMRYLGYKTDIRDIAYWFETHGSLLLGGFGVRPDAIAQYLKENTDYEVTSLGPARFHEYDPLFADAKAAVFTFWNGPDKWTIHTVMLRHLRSGRIRVFNMFNNRLYSDFDSVNALCSKNKLIPISLILISE